MKVILFLILSTLFVYNSVSQERLISNELKKSKEKWELVKNNRIKTQYIAVVPNKDSEFSDGKLVKIVHYDSTGKLSNTSEYEAYSDSIHTIYEYLDDGYLALVTKKASTNNILYIQYAYDDKGNITRIYSSGSERKDYICKYDKKGNLIQKKGYSYYPKLDKKGKIIPNDSDKVLVDVIKYKYDKSNNLKEEIVKINGKLISRTRYKYNKKNLKIEEKSKYLGNKITYKYKYDDDSKLTGYIRYNIDGTKSYFKAVYDYFK